MSAAAMTHDVVAEDLAPFVALVRGQDGGGVFVAARHELQEQHGSTTRSAGGVSVLSR